MPPILRTRPGVPIAAVGTWQAATGEWVCTAEQLRSAVAAEQSGHFRTPVLKLGHDDPRFNQDDGQATGDGQPAVGRLERLRLSDDGQMLLCDIVGIPAWLDDVMETAYPSRSIEALVGVITQDGGEWPMVVTGLALLGVQAPAIESLGDIADLFGVSRDVADYITAARARVAAAALPEGDQMPDQTPVPRRLGQVVTASASIEELTSAAEKWAEDQPALGDDCWVRDVLTDSLVFTAWRGDECTYWRATWTEANGAFTFGAPERVRQTYEPVPQGATVAPVAASVVRALARHAWQRANSHEPNTVPSPRGRTVTAGHQPGHQPQETNVPISPALAELLGVEPDADEQAVEAAARIMREKADAGPPAPTEQEGGTTTTPASAPDIDQLVTAAVKRATEPILAELTTATGQLAEIRTRDAKTTKDGVIASAVTAGKIAPAERKAWEDRYDKAPDVITEILDAKSPGSAVHVAASGHTGGESLTSAEDDALIAEYERMLAGGR